MRRVTQQGYFLVIAIILIFVIGAMGSLIAYLLSGRAMISPAELNGLRTFYLAESGLEATARMLVGTGAITRLTCPTLTGAAAVTDVSLLNGTFTATAVNNALYSASTTLSAGVTSTANSLPLTSVSGFAAHGRIRVDTEAIDYAAISGSSLVGLTRGASGTTAASHLSGAAVSESICLINVDAGIPSVAAPQYRRQLQMAVEILVGGDAWGVGDRQGNSFSLIRWDQPTSGAWNNYSVSDTSNRENLRDVSFSSALYGWTVGVEKSRNFTMLNWNGSSWTVASQSGACTGQDLYAVSTVSASEAWAVGARYRNGCGNNGPYRYDILKWNGSSWTPLAPASIPADANGNQNLNGVFMKDTSGNGLANLGFAVGNSGTILYYNGSVWSSVSSPTSNDLFGVATVSASEAWAVGAGGVILRWNGSSWSSVSSPTSVQLNDIRMIDSSGNGLANFGWAVGNSGTIIYYNGSSWSVQQSGGQDLLGIGALTSSYAWAVGKQSAIWGWDGTSWTSYTQPLTGNPDLHSVAITSTGASVTGSRVGSWQQIFR